MLARKSTVQGLLPGVLLSLLFAIAAYLTWYTLQDTWLKFSALLWAFIFSLVAGNTVTFLGRPTFGPGVEFCATRMLRWAIALLGLTISAALWVTLGWVGVTTVLTNLAFVFVFGFFFCRYVLKLDNSFATLIAVGTSICGATAIAAVGPAIKSKSEEMGLAVVVITLFGLGAMFAYPILFSGPLNSWLGNNATAYGMWAGMGVHEAAQVIAAASQVDGAVSVATSAKMIRVFMIGPMVFAALLVIRKSSDESGKDKIRPAIPWFALVFVLLTFVHLAVSSSPVRDQWSYLNETYLKTAITFLLAWAFAAVGLRVKFSSIRLMGFKATAAGFSVSLIAGLSALLLTKFLFLAL